MPHDRETATSNSWASGGLERNIFYTPRLALAVDLLDQTRLTVKLMILSRWVELGHMIYPYVYDYDMNTSHERS